MFSRLVEPPTVAPATNRRWDWSKWGPRIAWGAVALQLITALGLRGGDGRETYPFFRWDLFPSISSFAEDYDIVINQINGQSLDPPLSFRYAQRIFPAASRYEAYVVVQTLGHNVEKRHRRIWREAKDLFEHDYLANGLYKGVVVRSVDYSLVFIKYDPKDRYLHRAPPLQSRELASFEVAL